MAAGRSAFALTIALLCLLLVGVLAVSAAIGPYPVTLHKVLLALLRPAGGDLEPAVRTVLLEIRLPRTATAALVGAALAAAGASYQTLFRNPLVSPDILGVSAGAGLGAVVGILLSLPLVAVQMLGFAGGLATVTLVMLLASLLRGQHGLLVLVLSGIVVGAMAGAATSLVKVLADPYNQLPAITFWLLGSLARVTTDDLATVWPLVVLGLLPLALLRWRIGVLSLGDDEARALGVDAPRLRLVVIAAATLITSGVVAVSGVVGWVGLMVPHMARLLVGVRFDRLLPASVLLGASFMVGVDTLARTLAVVEVPLGILTAIAGAPLFVWLLARGRRTWAAP